MSFFLLLRHSNSSLDLLLLVEAMMWLYPAFLSWEPALPSTLFTDRGYGWTVCLQETSKADENEQPFFLCSDWYRDSNVIVGNHRKKRPFFLRAFPTLLASLMCVACPHYLLVSHQAWFFIERKRDIDPSAKGTKTVWFWRITWQTTCYCVLKFYVTVYPL